MKTMQRHHCYTTERKDSPAPDPDDLHAYWLQTAIEDRAESALPPPHADEETDR